LGAVRLKKSEDTGKPDQPKRTTCPHCDSSSAWNNEPWCPDCWYYPKLGRSVTETERQQMRKEAAPELPNPVSQSKWGTTLWGCLAIILLCTATVTGFPDHEHRPTLGRSLLLLGIVAAVISHARIYQHSCKMSLSAAIDVNVRE